MEIIWSLWLTACFTSTDCRYQDVQWFDTKQQCVEMKLIHEDIPMDGDWKQSHTNVNQWEVRKTDSHKINLIY